MPEKVRLKRVNHGNMGIDPRALADYGTQTWSQPNYFQSRPRPSMAYANRVVVERREHDATIRFFCDGKSSGSTIAEITVPLAVLDRLTGE